MVDEKAVDSAATDGKSPATSDGPGFQERFQAQLKAWRETGCPHEMDGAEGIHACGAAPHRSKMLPKDAEGNVTMSVDCAAGHENVWTFKAAETELIAEAERAKQAAEAAMRAGGQDPMKVSATITMDLRTQNFEIKASCPTPGLGIQLAGVLMSHFFEQLQEGSRAAKARQLTLPPRGLVHPKTGKPITN